jgi:hypothetical protein
VTDIAAIGEGLQDLYTRGLELRTEAVTWLDGWPQEEDGRPCKLADLDQPRRSQLEDLLGRLREWFNEVNVRALRNTLYLRRFLCVALLRGRSKRTDARLP